MHSLKRFLLLFLLVNASSVLAEEKVVLPEGVPALEDESRFLISSQNVSVYKDILPAQLYKWIANNQFLTFVSSELKFKFPSVGANLANLTASEILEEVQATQKVSSSVLYQFDYNWLNSQNVLQQIQAELFRTYEFSSALKPEKAKEKQDAAAKEKEVVIVNELSQILFKEVFYCLAPSNFASYFIKSTRSVGNKSDQVLLYSPLLKKKRSVFETNRGDAILNSVVSPNDFFVFSERLPSLQAQILKTQAMLVPFHSLEISKLKEGESVQELASEFAEGSGMLLFNYQSKQFPQAAPWLPTTVQFVPRNVILLELVYQDIFSDSGRALLIIDAESSLPIYKFVYDQKGDLLRSVIGIWGRAESTTESLSYLAALVAVDAKTGRADLLNTKRVQVLAQVPTEIEKLLLEE